MSIFLMVGNGNASDYRMSANSIVDPPLPGSGGAGRIIEPPLPDEPCFSYRYVEAGYVYQDFEPYFGDAGQGGGLELSYDFLGPIFAKGSFSWSKGDPDLTLVNARAGIGIYHEVYDCLHLTLEAGGRWAKTDYGRFSDSGFGYYAGPGLRAKFRQGVEIFGNAYFSGIDGDSGFLFDAGLVFDLTANLDLVLSGEFEDDSQSYLAGLRLNY